MVSDPLLSFDFQFSCRSWSILPAAVVSCLPEINSGPHSYLLIFRPFHPSPFPFAVFPCSLYCGWNGMTPQRALGASKQNLQRSGRSDERWTSPYLFVFPWSDSLKGRGRMTKLLNEPVNVPEAVVHCEFFLP